MFRTVTICVLLTLPSRAAVKQFMLNDTKTEAKYGYYRFETGGKVLEQLGAGFRLVTNGDGTFKIVGIVYSEWMTYGPFVFSNGTRIAIADHEYTLVIQRMNGASMDRQKGKTGGEEKQEEPRRHKQRNRPEGGDENLTRETGKESMKIEENIQMGLVLYDGDWVHPAVMAEKEKRKALEKKREEAYALRIAKQEEYALCLQAARMGDSHAQTIVGQNLLNGGVVAADAEQAVSWFRKASDGGGLEGMHWLAVCYYNGYGVKRDVDKALALWGDASTKGYALAKEALGVHRRAVQAYNRQQRQTRQRQQQYIQTGLLPNGIYRCRTIDEAWGIAQRLNAQNVGVQDANMEMALSGASGSSHTMSGQNLKRYKVVEDEENPGYFLVWPK